MKGGRDPGKGDSPGEEGGKFDPGQPELQLPIDGTLDLHTFRPGEVKDLVRDYVAACREKGILEVRIIHGKGTGTLKRIVESALSRMPEVIAFRPAGHGGGGWGATVATLAPPDKRGPA